MKSTLKRKLDILFSQYIRLRDTDESGHGECITCNKRIFWKDGDAGHFVTRNNLSTRFDERNVHLQCRRCNRFHGGMQYIHGQRIEWKYGCGTSEELFRQSRQTRKISVPEYEEMIAKYKERIVELTGQKFMG